MQSQTNQGDPSSVIITQEKSLIQYLTQNINKSKALIKLQIDSLQTQENIDSVSQANFLLITNLFKAFRMIRQSDQDNKAQQMRQKIQQQVKKCDKFIKLTQIRMIDTVQSIMKGIQNEKDPQSVQQLYQQFYIYCSEYMNKQYEYSNKLCVLLSQQAQAQAPCILSIPCQTVKSDIIAEKSNDCSFLTILQQKIKGIKKNYQNQILIRQRQVIKYQDQIEYYQLQLQNLINERDQLIQDINQFEQAIKKGSLKQAQQILQYINENKSEELKGIVKNKIMQRVNLAANQLNSQIQDLQKVNLLIKEENLNLNNKLQEYKAQIHRAGWIISIQSRQIMLNEQKMRQYEQQRTLGTQQVLSQNKNILSSNVSFNPNENLVKSKLQFGGMKANNELNIQNNCNYQSSQHRLKRTSYEPTKLSSLDQVFAKVKTPIKLFNYKKEI